VLEMVQDNLRRFHPGTAPQARRDLHPLEAAARLIPEDLLLLAPRSRDDAKDGSDEESAFWTGCWWRQRCAFRHIGALQTRWERP
jgi:hypothetical protein